VQFRIIKQTIPIGTLYNSTTIKITKYITTQKTYNVYKNNEKFYPWLLALVTGGVGQL